MENNENDFQKSLRKEFIAIHSDKRLTPQEKANLMQALMTTRLQSSYGGGQIKEDADQNLACQNQSPTYFNVEEKILGCKHYSKNCKIRAECCKKFFTCRRCHDEQINDHKINRYEIQTMICMLCQTIQPVSQTCTHCSTSMARYYCVTCKFFDNDPNKKIWHCDKCGLCRVGNGQYYHCDICHMCISSENMGHTKHIERAFEANCPICGEWMQTSTQASFQPDPCQHAIHKSCYKKYREQHYACPICSRTYGDFNTASWIVHHQMISRLPMPPEYNNWRVEILCNDCNIKTECPYHFLGHACQKCAGYNTKITRTMRPESDQHPTDTDQSSD